MKSSNMKKLLSYISDFLLQELTYFTISKEIAHFPEFQKKDLIAQTMQKVLTTSNLNIYSCQSDRPWSEIEEVLYYNGKKYIAETFQADLLEKNHDDFLAEHFEVETILELFTSKYCSSKFKSDVEKYVQNVIYTLIVSLKELYGNL